MLHMNNFIFFILAERNNVVSFSGWLWQKFFHILLIFQNEKLSQLVGKLDQLSNQNKKQDLLDMELEEAESRYENANLIHYWRWLYASIVIGFAR